MREKIKRPTRSYPSEPDHDAAHAENRGSVTHLVLGVPARHEDAVKTYTRPSHSLGQGASAFCGGAS